MGYDEKIVITFKQFVVFNFFNTQISNEKCFQDVFGALQVMPVSSGFCLGSSNWVITSSHEKIAYVSGSSTLTTHPRPINQAALKNADLLIIAGLTQTPAHNPDNMLGDLCMNACK